MKIERARRLDKLPPYLFKEIDRLKSEVQARGIDVINVSIGDPDKPTPPSVIEAGQEAMADPANHRYPSYVGMPAFREAVARWFEKRFGVKADPVSQITALVGSKEGVFHLPLAFVDPGDIVLCPDPAYPVYSAGAIFAGGEVYSMPLLAENSFFPDFSAIPDQVAHKAKLMWLNYPNNPTSAEATVEQFKTAVDFALAHGIIICHDAAYTEMTFDGLKAPSFLQTPGAMECSLETHSFSKPFQMTGWRIGMAVGNAELISGLGEVKSNVDSGTFQAIQVAAIKALAIPAEEQTSSLDIYRLRRKIVVSGLERMGLEVWPTRATFYVWAKNPDDLTSAEWAAKLLSEAGIVVTPGNGFGAVGEGWFRIALSQPRARLSEMIERMEGLGG